MVSAVPQRESVLRNIVQRVAGRLAIERQADAVTKADLADSQFWTAWDAIRGGVTPDVMEYAALRHVKKELKDIVFGYGPVDLLATADHHRNHGGRPRTDIHREERRNEELGPAVRLGRRDRRDHPADRRPGGPIDQRSRPLVDARPRDESRVNAVTAAWVVNGPGRQSADFRLRRLLIDDLVARSLTATVAKFLRAAVIHVRNIIVSGGTGTGKTTLLNCLSDFIPDAERIVTVEDTAELRLNKEHVVRLETQGEEYRRQGAYTIRDLVKNALRMRPDRVVVGECRSGETLDMPPEFGAAGLRHAERAVEELLRVHLVRDGVAGAAAAGARRVAGLRDEARDHAVERDAVVEAVAREEDEAVHRLAARPSGTAPA